MSEIKRESKLLETVKKLLREVDFELIALVRTQRSRRIPELADRVSK